MAAYLLLIRAAEHTSYDLLSSGSAGLAHLSERAQALGATVHWLCVLTSNHDLAMIVDLPDERTLAFELALKANGFEAEAHRAYSAEDLDKAREALIAITPATAETVLRESGVGDDDS